MTNKRQPSTRADVITRRTYNRPNDDGTFETWSDTVERVIDHQRWLWERAKGSSLGLFEEVELADLRELMLNREATVSGRTLWLGGTDVSKQREASQFNCSFGRIETVHDVVDAFWLLLQGCGVGFEPVVGTLNGFVKPVEVQVLRSTKVIGDPKGYEKNQDFMSVVDGRRIYEIIIGDSAEAWAKAAGKIVAIKEPFDVLRLNFREVRAPGIRLKGYGWISSGDETISIAFTKIAELLSKRAGKLLTRIDILDLMNWLGTTLSSRRSAEIALMPVSDPEVDDFILAKKDYWLYDNAHRQQSNNSIVFHSKPTKWELSYIFDKMVEAGGSEPGFINAESAKKRAPWFKGVNPCAEIMLGNKSFCVAGNTKLITEDGITEIQKAVGRKIKVWNGKKWAEVTPFKTGDKDKLLRVSFGDGSYLDVTENHRFFVKDRFGKKYVEVLAKDLMGHSKYTIHTEPFTMVHTAGSKKEFAYDIGFYVGDGSGNHVSIYSEAKSLLPLAGKLVADGYQNGKQKWRLTGLPYSWKEATELKHDLTPAFSWDKESILQFISGLADADGSNTSSGGIRIYQANEDFCRDLQLLLTKVGIKSSVNFMSDKDSNFGKRKPMFYVQISDTTSLLCNRLDCTYSGGKSGKGKYQTILSVEPIDGEHESFCFTEPETTKGVFGNSLTGQCNLVEVDWGKFLDNFEELKRAVYLIARANYRQTCVNLDDGILQRSWHELNEFLRLCGVGGTGIVKFLDYNKGFNNVPAMLQALKAEAKSGAYSMADDLGLPRPKAVTTVKPSGTLSKIMDTTEGVHKPLGKYIFNNVTFSRYDEIIPTLVAAGYRVFDKPNSPDSVLVTFPVAYEDVRFDTVGGKEVNLESAVDQLERYKVLMDNYVDHNCSVTISYDVEEVPAIIEWILDNWDTYVGVSFIYRNDPTKTAKDLGYEYLPQEVVTKEDYDAYVQGLLYVDLTTLASTDDLSDEACTTGACPIR